MKNYSTKNTYGLSDGTRKTRTEIGQLTRQAKIDKLQEQLTQDGYYHCEFEDPEKCEKTFECKTLDCSHVIPVSECLNSGRAELAYDTDNIKIVGRKCHKIKDKLNLQFKK